MCIGSRVNITKLSQPFPIMVSHVSLLINKTILFNRKQIPLTTVMGDSQRPLIQVSQRQEGEGKGHWRGKRGMGIVRW